MKRFIIILIIVIILIFGIVAYDFFNKTSTPYQGYEEPVIINVKTGSSVTAVAAKLYSRKVISNYYYFRLYYRLFYKDTSFKSGEYLFDKALTMEQVIHKLSEGKVIL